MEKLVCKFCIIIIIIIIIIIVIIIIIIIINDVTKYVTRKIFITNG